MKNLQLFAANKWQYTDSTAQKNINGKIIQQGTIYALEIF